MLEQYFVDIRTVFAAMPGSNVLLKPDAPRFTILDVSVPYLQATGRKKEELIGKGLFDAFPGISNEIESGEQSVRGSLTKVLASKQTQTLPLLRYDLVNSAGVIEQRFWSTHNHPVAGENGEVSFIIHSAEDITQQVKAEQREERISSIEKAYGLFMSAPVIIGIMQGDDYIIELANDNLLEVLGRTSDVIGKPLLMAMPELQAQGIKELLDTVRTTGEPFYANEFPLTIRRFGKEELRYFDFVYKPIYEEEGSAKASGVISIGHDVTAQVTARNNEQESEAKYRSLSESVDQGFCVLEMIFDSDNKPIDYRFTEINPLFEAQTGLKNAIGKTAKQLVPDIEQHWIDRYAEVAVTGRSTRFSLDSAAMARWFDVFAYKIGGKESRKVGLLFTDITQRKSIETALKESEERFRKALTIQTVGVVFFNLEGQIIDANEAFERMSGHSRQQLSKGSVRWDSLTAPEYMNVTLKSSEQLRTTGESTPYEKQYIRPDGSRWWGLCADKRLSDNECVEFILDITESKNAQQALYRSEEQTRAIIDSAPFPIGVYIGREMRIAFANQSIIQVWKKGDDIIGKRYREVLPELATQEIYPQLDAVFESGMAFHAKNQRVDLLVDGELEPFYFNYSFTPLFDSEGSVYGVMNTAADVTDLNTALEQVRQSEANVRNMILQAPVAMCILLGPEFIVDVANEAMIKLWGKNAATVMNRPVFEALPDAREQGLESLIEHVYQSGESVSASERPVGLFRNGEFETTYQNFVYQPHRSSDGSILGVLAISVEVTEQVRARKMIEEAEQRARLAIESAGLGTYDVHLPSQHITTSQRFRDIWGVGLNANREDYVKMIYPPDLPGREKALREGYERGTLNYELRLMGEGHSVKWVKVRGIVLKDDEEKPLRVLGVLQDITEQKLFSEELKKRVAEQTKELVAAQDAILQVNIYFKHIINTLESGLAALIPVFEGGKIVDFRFKLTNQVYSRYSLLSPEEIENKLVSEVFPGYYQTDAFEKYAEVFNTGVSQTWELHYNVDKLNVYLIVTASRQDEEVMVNFSEVSELKNLQLDLLRKIEELERANESLEEFTYAASHDLKEPIRKILVFINRLREYPDHRQSPSEKLYFERIEVAANRMKTLIEDLLTYSEANNKATLEDDVDLNGLIEQVLIDFDLEIEQKHAKITVEKLFTMRGHRRQLQQALHNLVGNALKYTRPGTTPEISISYDIVKGRTSGLWMPPDEINEDFHQILITDNGIGFDQSHAEKIFKVFTRLHGNSEYKGTGVGLAIVRKVAENHRGHVWAESAQGKGATFHIIFPVKAS